MADANENKVVWSGLAAKHRRADSPLAVAISEMRKVARHVFPHQVLDNVGIKVQEITVVLAFEALTDEFGEYSRADIPDYIVRILPLADTAFPRLLME